MKKLLFLLFFLSLTVIQAQDYFPTDSGVKTTENTTFAFTNATIYLTPDEVIKNGTLLIKDGKVVSVGKSVKIPKGAKTTDLEGKIIYPSFIDIYADFGIEKPKRSSSTSRTTQYDASREGYYWNDHIRPDTNPIEDFKFDSKKAKELIDAGFGVVNTHMQDGIIRGTGLLVALNPNASNAYRILNTKSAHYLSFDRSVQTRQSYPNSRMGAMALLRQVYNDANWYAKGNMKNKDMALEALNGNKNLVQIFETGNHLDALRADKVGDEFSVQYTIVGSGDEYERVTDIKATNANFIIPINFSNAYDVSNPLLAQQISLRDMRKWNQEPSNLSVLSKNGINFALTTHDLKSVKSFHKNLQKAIKYGFDTTKALAALTTIPAQIIGSTAIGNLKTGSHANFIITSGDIFDAKTTLFENWVQGGQNVINDMKIKDITGTYTVNVNDKNYDLTIAGKGAKQTGALKMEDKKVKATFSFKDNWVSMTLHEESGFTRMLGKVINVDNEMQGTAYDSLGTETTWSASKKAIEDDKKETSDKKEEKEEKEMTVFPVSYPNLGFGNFTQPEATTILIKNVTVWTSEDDGILENTDVLLKDGKIDKIGKNLKARKALEIDGTGKHLTAGIVDEHSHIATSAVNEGGQNSSAEVTIEDVVDPTDINIYRNISGGTTSAQILHGSANPIGGRSAIIKLKWGENAANMMYDNSPKFIKFALGENVKQSRSSNGVRFPQTRMGVEQMFTDYFTRAKEYEALKKSGNSYRKDTELETLVEILNGERFISCHSYVQSEINMLMKVAEKFNFRVNTFTHILEGYKVADKMAEHGVGGSTFSDWWGYKYEVNDAIPFNAAIMHNAGVTVAINSDDAEMSRRLNQEAAKTIKYGGMSELEAWKTVTINPAKLLHIDDKVGSIKIGKDADVVLWSDHPMSIYAKAEKTIIDGKVFFDLEKDAKKRVAISEEKSKLINMMLKEKMSGGKTKAPMKRGDINFQCDTLEELKN
ncbi:MULTISPECIES: amidohydrolase family protein [unclassified Polaribacter]|uniref:amidohydrolase family protein n=1 Tax=unclassified Polaribacter TaxID=196858 RepID=UPI0011BFDC4D|nr:MULTISPECIES: amidohydrolase family protein [unclassified Polaribacter]TXD52544.1 amidohydrolase family protein [Polaribacter sp. IC063]TXD60530.1 amidohydrolase family protein [Polaribacter sp. IC066]